MKFEPGYYKVKVKDGYFGTTYHYMRVFVKERKKYIQIDHGFAEEAERCEEDMVHHYQLVKRITKPIEINNLRVLVSWKDEEGHEFKMTAANSAVLQKIFDLFPRLSRVFGFGE